MSKQKWRSVIHCNLIFLSRSLHTISHHQAPRGDALGQRCCMTGSGVLPQRDWQKVFTIWVLIPLGIPPGLAPYFYPQSPPNAQPKHKLQSWKVEAFIERSPGELVWKCILFLWVCTNAVAACDGQGAEDCQQEQPESTGSSSRMPLIRLLIVSSFDLASCTMTLIKHFLKRCFKAWQAPLELLFSFLFVNWLKANINIYLQLGKRFAARNLNVLFSSSYKWGNY